MEAVQGDVETAGDRLDDAEIRLMRDKASDLGRGDSGIDKNLLGGLDHGGDSMLVGLAAVHADGDRVLGRGGGVRRVGTSAAGDVEDVGKGAVTSHAGRHDSLGSFAVPEDGGSGSVAEEDAGVPIRPVDDAGELISADHEDGPVGPGGDVLARSLDPEEESGARGREVEADGIDRADLGLHEAGGVREEHVGGDGGADDEVDLPGLDPGIPDGGLRGARSHLAGRHLGPGDTALTDAGTAQDPLVAGLHQLL